MKSMLLLFIILIGFSSVAQELDSTREVRLTLIDIPYSGDDIQPNFRVNNTEEILSFNRANWQEKALDLYEFRSRYEDHYQDSTIEFTATLVYDSVPIYNYIRSEGFEETGKYENVWVLKKIRSDYNFDVLVSAVVGDLNKDGILDLAMIMQDTACHSGQYLLEVYFTQPNGDKIRIVSSTEAIEPRYPFGKGRYMPSQGHSTLSIKRGVLWIETGFIRGHMEHKFRYQNNHFELIGYSFADILAGQLTIIDFNLSTGRRIEKAGTISDDTYTVVSDEIVKISPLPCLEEFRPYAHNLY